MDIVYVDESGDDCRPFSLPAGSSTTKNFALSAIAVPEEHWYEMFDVLKAWRRDLRTKYGIYVRAELHAKVLLRGGGKISANPVPRRIRATIFREALELLETHGPRLGVWVTNILLPNRVGQRNYQPAVERLVNRLHSTSKTIADGKNLDWQRYVTQELGTNPYQLPVGVRSLINSRRNRCVLAFDEGHDALIRTVTRKMQVSNNIPSRFGTWPSGLPYQNIRPDNVIGDPFVRESHHDLFIQLADFVAYALLKSAEVPTQRIRKYRIHKSFDILDAVLNKRASIRDPKGVVRN